MVDTNVHRFMDICILDSSSTPFIEKLIQIINILNCMDAIKFSICGDLIFKLFLVKFESYIVRFKSTEAGIKEQYRFNGKYSFFILYFVAVNPRVIIPKPQQLLKQWLFLAYSH